MTFIWSPMGNMARWSVASGMGWLERYEMAHLLSLYLSLFLT